MCLRLGTAAHRSSGPDAPGVLRRLPAGLTTGVIRDFALLGLANDVAQDRRVWETKRHLRRPVLAAGDGPIGRYRRWAAQFLPGPAVQEATEAGTA